MYQLKFFVCLGSGRFIHEYSFLQHGSILLRQTSEATFGFPSFFYSLSDQTCEDKKCYEFLVQIFSESFSRIPLELRSRSIFFLLFNKFRFTYNKLQCFIKLPAKVFITPLFFIFKHLNQLFLIVESIVGCLAPKGSGTWYFGQIIWYHTSYCPAHRQQLRGRKEMEPFMLTFTSVLVSAILGI